MPIREVVLLKAKKGEATALANCTDAVARRVRPLFEIGRIGADLWQRKYMLQSPDPTAAYLDRVVDGIANCWTGREAMLDGYYWPPEALTGQGDHVLAYAMRRLEAAGVPTIPVVGYERWENEVYQAAMKGIVTSFPDHWCLRLDSDAIDDSAEPDFFQTSVFSILEGLGLLPGNCSVLMDLGDIGTVSLMELIDRCNRVVQHLSQFGFRTFTTMGCSVPSSINLAVKNQDSANTVIRKEMLLWKALRQELAGIPLLYGDYGVRGPTTNDDVHSPNTNGKIRYTIDQQLFVLRGHAFSLDHSADQMYDLAGKLVRSPHYLGTDFSWGDKRINAYSTYAFKGSPTDWIAIDTNHHLAYATQEVEAFEQSVLAQGTTGGI